MTVESNIGYGLRLRGKKKKEIVHALRTGYRSVQAIAESIYDGLAPALMPAAHENVRAHLEKLKKERLAVDEDGRWTLQAS